MISSLGQGDSPDGAVSDAILNVVTFSVGGLRLGVEASQVRASRTLEPRQTAPAGNDIETLLGLGVEPRNLTFVQISLRGIIVFLVTLVAVRLGHKRSLSRKTPFDAVLLVILAAVLSRAINGSAAFFATLGGGMVLVVLHRLFAFLTFYSHRFGILVKGRPDVIVRDGQCDVPMMWRNHVSRHDLDEDMRLSVHIEDLSRIRIARVERSGDISFIKK